MWKVLHRLSPNDLNITFGESGRLGIKGKLPALPKLCKESAKILYDSSFGRDGPPWAPLLLGELPRQWLGPTQPYYPVLQVVTHGLR